ncbi:MAG: ribonuclease HIII [Parachlamydiaceae bacterium]
MPTPTHFVKLIDLKLASQLSKDLTEQGFLLTTPPCTLFSGKKKGISCTLYTTGKLVVQGKEMGEFIEFYLEPFLQAFTYTYPELEVSEKKESKENFARIGIDESGKGDYFGPLCIAGVYADQSGAEKLRAIGVQDSKELSDIKILQLAKKIRAEFVHHIVKINPQKYNELYAQFNNLNHLLAWGHATVIENLVERTKCESILVDQFANESVVLRALKRKNLKLDVVQQHRAEEDVIVAAASILARETFLTGLEKLGEEFGIKLPKGASKATIEAGRAFVRKYGSISLSRVGKIHFKTTSSIL